MGFCHSDEDVIVSQHVPWLRGMSDHDAHDELAELVLPYARQIWADLQQPEGGQVQFKHDHYFKMWALTEPALHYEFLLLDEAQDTNPVLERVFTAQRTHSQLVMVGDSAQAIFGWRGARDVMTAFAGTGLTLSRSFRFDDAVAAEANRWLALAAQPLRLTGTPNITSTVGPVDDPKAVLCRTNGGAMAEILSLLRADRRVALVGGGDALRQLAGAVRDLKAGRRTLHHELLLFATWSEVQDYAADDPAGRDLQPLVDVIDHHGVDVVLDTLDQLSDETDVEVIVSTVHKAKGREWSAVRIADDFPEPEDPNGPPGLNCRPGPIDPGEARLAYVAVTRAQHRLDIGSLAGSTSTPMAISRPTAPPGALTEDALPGRAHTGLSVVPPPSAEGSGQRRSLWSRLTGREA